MTTPSKPESRTNPRHLSRNTVNLSSFMAEVDADKKLSPAKQIQFYRLLAAAGFLYMGSVVPKGHIVDLTGGVSTQQFVERAFEKRYGLRFQWDEKKKRRRKTA